MSGIDRRRFLLAAAGAAGAGVLLGACGDDGSEAAAPTTEAVGAGGVVALIPSFPDGFRAPSPFVAGVEHRVAYALRNELDVMRDDAPDQVELRVLFGDEEVAGGSIPRRDTGVPTPYFPVWFTPAEPGTYTTVYGDGTGGPALRHDFLVLAPGETTIPQPGDLLPPVATATVDDARGVTPLCTRAEPCPFHADNLTDVLAAADKPIVLSIATPGFCQTAICGPVVDLLIERIADRDDLHVIHAEVYVDPNAGGGAVGFGDTTEIVTAYDLPFEPVLYVCTADGTVVRRLDAVYDGSELDEALALV